MNQALDIKKAARILKDAKAVLICSGAGMSADSGLPTFRGKEGLWKAYPPLKKQKVTFSELANPMWFVNDPQLAWSFYAHRLNLYRKTEPHDGYRILQEMVESKPKGYFSFTSNVDGHFQKAGFEPERIVEIHGSLHHFQCTRKCTDHIWECDQYQIPVDETKLQIQDTPPQCLHCNRIARPNVLMFKDRNWISDRTEEQEERLQHWLNQIADKELAVIEIGAGIHIPTVRSFAERITAIKQGTLIRISLDNPWVRGNGNVAMQMSALNFFEALA